MRTIQVYEGELSTRFLRGLREYSRITVYGLTDLDSVLHRTPTFAIRIEGIEPEAAALRLGEQGIFVWSGDLYAVDLINRLGVAESGGVIRLGFVHYNTMEEVDRTLDALAAL